MRLAAAALDRARRLRRCAIRCLGQIEAALRQHRRRLPPVPWSRARSSTLCSMSSCRPAARMRDVGKLREDEAELGEEAEHLARDALDVVLPADDDEARDLVADQHVVVDGDGVLHAVQPLRHLEIERGGRAPADRRGDDDGVGPMHQRLIDLVHLVLVVHLGDRAGPGAGLRRLGIIALAGAEFQVVELDQLGFGAELGRLPSAHASADDRSRRSADWRRPSRWWKCPRAAAGPAARSTLRSSGCGGCGLRLRLVGCARSTSTRPFSTFTGKDGTRSSSKPGSPTPLQRWNFH